MKTEFEVEREAQLNYGRKKLTMPTLATSRGKNVNNTGGRPSKDAQDFKKEKKVGHEETLAKLIFERKFASIHFNDGTILHAEVLQFDNYSIKLRDDDGNVGWWFKSSLKGFVLLEKAEG